MWASPIMMTLCLALDGLRFEGGGGKEVKRIIGLNLHDLILQCPFQSRPDPRLHEGIQGIEDQITSVGPQERARLDMGEIGLPDPGAVDDPFDGAKKVSVVGRRFNDDRGSFGLRIVHQHIDLVFGERVHRLRQDQPRDGWGVSSFSLKRLRLRRISSWTSSR